MQGRCTNFPPISLPVRALACAALAVLTCASAHGAAVPASRPPADWTKVADERGSFTVSGTRRVRYGFSRWWVELTVTGTGQCTDEFFGTDPFRWWTKTCWAEPASVEPPPPPPSPPPPAPPPPSPPTGDDHHPAGYTLWFNDEFDGTQLDRTAWCTRYIYGGGASPQLPDPECQRNGEGTLDFLNDEQQRYVDTNRSGQTMHVVENGTLSLRATKTRTDSWASYEAAMIRSKRTFAPNSDNSYYVTARVMLPNVRGTWPALWLNPDRDANGRLSWPPEIDILEGPLNEVEDRADMLHQTTQIRGRQTASGAQEITFSAPEFNRQWGNYHAGRSLRDVWIEVGAEWTATGVCYFVDGYRTMCENYRWVDNNGAAVGPAHVLLNLAIGGQWAGRHGIADDKFPTQMRVDYVRVYRK